jgi:hypothetical protein
MIRLHVLWRYPAYAANDLHSNFNLIPSNFFLMTDVLCIRFMNGNLILDVITTSCLVCTIPLCLHAVQSSVALSGLLANLRTFDA